MNAGGTKLTGAYGIQKGEADDPFKLNLVPDQDDKENDDVEEDKEED